MPKLVRLVIIASALVSGLRAGAVALEPRRLSPPPSAWPDSQPRNGQPAAAGGPAQPYASQAVDPPRPLPQVYPGQVTPASTNSPVAAPLPLVRPAGPQRPIFPLQGQGKPASPWDRDDLRLLVTGGASLGIVLGLFLLVVWTMRRAQPRGAAWLPAEAVEVLGRVPLAGRQQAHLLRCGNKIVLVSVTASGVEPLTEITDPMEVDRLETICRHGSAAANPLKQFLARFGGQANSRTLAGGPSEPLDFRHLEAGSHHQA